MLSDALNHGSSVDGGSGGAGGAGRVIGEAERAQRARQAAAEIMGLDSRESLSRVTGAGETSTPWTA